MRKNEGLMKIVVVAIVFALMVVPVQAQEGPVSYGDMEFPLGNKSFADGVVSFNPGKDTVSPYNNPQNAIGTPNGCGENAVALGHGGILTVKFTNNYLIDVEGADLYVLRGSPTFFDTDGDGVQDDIDQCHGTPAGVAVDERGCPTIADSDGDGVPDDVDQCPGTPAGVAVDERGCPTIADSDGDGVPDDIDECLGTPAGVAVDDKGCPVPIPVDSDGDGVPDDVDACHGTPAGVAVDDKGCPEEKEETCVTASSDSDGIARSTNFNIPAGLVGTDVWWHVDTSFMQIDGPSHTDRVGCQLTGPVNWKGGITWSDETYGPAAPKTLPAGDYTFNMEWHGKLDTCRLCYTLKRGATSNLTQQRLYPVADGRVYTYSYRNWNWANMGMYESMFAGWNQVGGEMRAYLRFDLPAGLDAITPEENCVIASSDSDGIARSTNFNIPAGLVGTDVWWHVDTLFMQIDGPSHTDRVGCQLTGQVNWKGGVTWSDETYGPATPKTLPAGNYTFNMEQHGKLDTCRLCYTLKPVPYVPYNNSRAYVLKLYQYHSVGPVHSLGVYRVTSSWEEGTDTYHSGKVEETAAPGELCWMQQPSFDPVPVATFTSATAVPAWVEVNITSLVQQWQAGTPNYGLVVKTTNEHPTASDPAAWSGYLTKEHPDQANRPVLELSLSGTAPLPTPSEPPLKQSVCASFKPRIGDASESKPAEFTIGGTEPQKVSITSHADNFAIMAIPGMKVVYRVSDGKSSGSLTLAPGTYRLSCGGGGAGYHESATVCIEYPVVTGTPPAPTP